MPPKNRKKKGRSGGNAPQTSNPDKSAAAPNSSKKKIKKKDLRGPHWKANLDYVSEMNGDEKKKYPVVKGIEAFDLQREYLMNPEKFTLDTLSGSLKSKLSTIEEKLTACNQFHSQDPLFKTKLGYSYLHFVCEAENKNNGSLLQWLLDHAPEVSNESNTAYLEQVDIQNRFLQTPLHLAAQNTLLQHIKILIDNGADPRIVTTDGYNAVDIAKLKIPKEWTDLEGEPPDAIKILHLLETTVDEFEEEERQGIDREANVPKYQDSVQKYLLRNGNNMQVDLPPMRRNCAGDMNLVKDSQDKRMIVKVQRPSIGEGMCLVYNKDKTYHSFLMEDHAIYSTINSMIQELSESKTKAYFYATPLDEYHLIIHDIFAPTQSW